MDLRVNSKTENSHLTCGFFVEKSWAGSVGVEYLVGVLRYRGYEVRVVFDDFGTKPWSSADPRAPGSFKALESFYNNPVDVLFLSVVTDYYQRALAVAQSVKRRHPHTIICVGGPHPTYCYQHVLYNQSIDYICRGEGDIAILELLDFIRGDREDLPAGIYRLNNGSIEGKGFGVLVENLDDLPFPDKSDLYKNLPRYKNIYTTVTGRGCYNKCSYCNSCTIRGYYREDGHNFLRRRSVDNVIAELKYAKQRYNPRHIVFFDDSFIHNERFLCEFADRYKQEIGLSFSCMTNPNFFNEDILKKLVEAGLVFVEIGIQSLNPAIRNGIFLRPESNEDITRFISLVQKLGVYVHVDHIINPWDQRAELLAQLKLYNHIRPSWINVFYLTYYPNTQIIDFALRDGFMSPEDKESINRGIIPKNYFFGGNVGNEQLTKLKDLALFLTFIPLLPRGLISWILASGAVRLFRLLPHRIILFARTFNALIKKDDFWGRENLKNYLLGMFGC
jgi:radical SAM superfamily enzyme YgiQ (UPF0313 family)